MKQRGKFPQAVWGLLLVAVLTASGCTGGGAQTEQTAQNSSAQAANSASRETANPDGGAEVGETRKVQTPVGEIQIPAHPQRIIVDWNVGHVLALGLTPVGIPYSLLDYGTFLKEGIPESVQDIGNHNEVSVERMIELEPDLIITWGTDKYEQYAKIAPTLVFLTEEYGSMEEQVTALGEYLNRQQEATAWNTAFARRVEAARVKVAPVIPEDATFTLVDYNWDKGILVVGNTANRGGTALYELLGLKPHPQVEKDIIAKGESSAVISWEVFGDYVGDYLLELTDEAAKPERVEAVWSQLDAVKNDRRIELDLRKYFSADPFAAILQAEELAELLIAKAGEQGVQ